MSATHAYLDHNATAPIRPGVLAAMTEALECAGNPSSVHTEGRAARALVEMARDHVAALVGAKPRDVTFTSGGSEAAATVLTPGLARGGACPGLLLVSATEHVCVRDGHRFAQDKVETIPVKANGLVDLDWLEARLARHDGMALVSVHAANNETGVIQPIAEISAITNRYDAILHVDAVQAAGRVPLDMAALGADVMTISAHKFGGPKGAGAIVMGAHITLNDRLIRGGGQERSLRAGTENVPGIAGFGAAALAARQGMAAEMMGIAHLRDEFERRLVEIVPEAAIFGHYAPRLPNTSAFAIPGLSAERAMILFDLNGVSVSSGSACSSGKVRRSHVLDAMGIEAELANAALRISLGWSSSMDEIELALQVVQKAAAKRKNEIQAAA